MLAFLGIDQTECACVVPPCLSVDKFVKFYIFRKYVHVTGLLKLKQLRLLFFICFSFCTEISTVFKGFLQMVRMDIWSIEIDRQRFLCMDSPIVFIQRRIVSRILVLRVWWCEFFMRMKKKFCLNKNHRLQHGIINYHEWNHKFWIVTQSPLTGAKYHAANINMPLNILCLKLDIVCIECWMMCSKWIYELLIVSVIHSVAIYAVTQVD